MAGDRHGFVECGDVEGDGVGDDRDVLARGGVLDEQVFAHAALCAAAADDAGGDALRVDDDAVARLEAVDLRAHLDDLAGRLVAERYRDHLSARAQWHAAHVEEGDVGSADAAGADAQEYVSGAGDGAVDVHHVDGA